MLPEHVKMLRQWAEEDSWAEQKQLDEQKLEILNETAAEAMEFGKTVLITYFNLNQYKQIMGTLHYFDDLKKEFRIMDESGKVQRISLTSIDQIQIIEQENED